MAERTLDELLADRLKLIDERGRLRERLQVLTAEIDIRLDAQRGDRLYASLSTRDRALLAQTIQARGIDSEESVNG